MHMVYTPLHLHLYLNANSLKQTLSAYARTHTAYMQYIDFVIHVNAWSTKNDPTNTHTCNMLGKYTN